MLRKKHLVFASYELFPVNRGGCGVFIWNALQELLKEGEFEITLLLDMPKQECDLFIEKYQSTLPNGNALHIVRLADIVDVGIGLGLSDFNNIFLWKSYMFYQGLLVLSKRIKIDYVEFFDYAGVAYYSVRAKRYLGRFPNVILSIRAHCTIELMDAEQTLDVLTYEHLVMYEMEKKALQAADIVVTPSLSWRDLYGTRYDVNDDNIVVCPLPTNLEDFPVKSKESTKPNVLFYGRIFQLKGVDVFIEAALSVLEHSRNSLANFYLIGYDGTTPQGGSYQERLLNRIPNRFRNRFHFLGHVDHGNLASILDSMQVAVFPNYVESFSYSIHEIYRFGLPIICRPIPAFQDYFSDGENCLTFDGTVDDLSNKIIELLSNPQLRQKLSFPFPVIDNTGFVPFYRRILDTVGEKTDAKVHNKTQCLSIVIFNEENSCNTDYSDFVAKYSGFVCVQKSFVLSPPADDSKRTVYFWGKRWKVSHLDGKEPSTDNLGLCGYVWIGHEGTRPHEDFIENAINVMERHTDIEFVGSFAEVKYKEGRRDNLFSDIDMEVRQATNFQFNHVPLVIRVTENQGLQNLFDVRYGALGMLAYLRKTGYIIPQILLSISDPPPPAWDWGTCKFAIHQKMVQNGWDPKGLVNLLLLKHVELSSHGDSSSAMGMSWKRILVNEIRYRLSNRNNAVARFQLRVFEKIVAIIRR